MTNNRFRSRISLKLGVRLVGNDEPVKHLFLAALSRLGGSFDVESLFEHLGQVIQYGRLAYDQGRARRLGGRPQFP